MTTAEQITEALTTPEQPCNARFALVPRSYPDGQGKAICDLYRIRTNVPGAEWELLLNIVWRETMEQRHEGFTKEQLALAFAPDVMARAAAAGRLQAAEQAATVYAKYKAGKLTAADVARTLARIEREAEAEAARAARSMREQAENAFADEEQEEEPSAPVQALRHHVTGITEQRAEKPEKIDAHALLRTLVQVPIMERETQNEFAAHPHLEAYRCSLNGLILTARAQAKEIAPLVEFARLTLAILQEHSEWNSDTTDAIAQTAYSLRLADSGDDASHFRILTNPPKPAPVKFPSLL